MIRRANRLLEPLYAYCTMVVRRANGPLESRGLHVLYDGSPSCKRAPGAGVLHTFTPIHAHGDICNSVFNTVVFVPMVILIMLPYSGSVPLSSEY